LISPRNAIAPRYYGSDPRFLDIAAQCNCAEILRL
jgi:hypothetical protein